MTVFIDEHRGIYGVEPICKVLPIAPSTCYVHAARKADPSRCPVRARQGAVLCGEVQRVWEENRQAYGARKVRKQMGRKGWQVARSTVARLMCGLGIRGVIRGKCVKTTMQDKALPCPQDRVNRQLRAERPSQL